MTTDQDPEYYSVAEIARRLRLSKMTVYRLIESGELPAHQFGRTYRVSADDFNAYVMASQVGDAR